MFSKLVSQGSNFVMEGVKNLVVKRHVCLVNLKLHISLLERFCAELAYNKNRRSSDGIQE